MTSLFEILKASKTGLAPDLLTLLRGRKYAAQHSAQERELEGVPPLPFNSNGEPLIAWTIFANFTQSGTPTPDSPISPSETGERTNNLLDLAKIEKGRINQTSGEVTVVSDTTVLTVSGNNVTVTTTKEWRGFISDYIPTTEALKFSYGSLSNVESGTNFYCYFYAYDSNKQYLGYVYQGAIPEGTAYLRASFQFNVAVTNAVVSEIMLNTGSTAMDFEPYGCKLPVQCGGVTTPVYTAEPLRKIGDYTDYKSESAEYRAIKKLVLTGNETISVDLSYDRFFFSIMDMRGEGVRLTKLYCTHYQNISDGRPIGSVPDNSIYTGGGVDIQKVFIKTTEYTTVADFKAYLAQQYANGTPVCVWYVLATPTTESITAPEIPTTAGSNTFDVDTTLKPSKVYIKYKG